VKASALLLFLCCSLPVLGQQTKKTAVVFDCDCTDPVASQYATAVRDLLASSPRYYLANEAEEKGTDGKISLYNWHLKVVSLDSSIEHDGTATAFSVVLLLGNSLFMSHEIQTCGANRVSYCASTTVSFMDRYLSAK